MPSGSPESPWEGLAFQLDPGDSNLGSEKKTKVIGIISPFVPQNRVPVLCRAWGPSLGLRLREKVQVDPAATGLSVLCERQRGMNPLWQLRHNHNRELRSVPGVKSYERRSDLVGRRKTAGEVALEMRTERSSRCQLSQCSSK